MAYGASLTDRDREADRRARELLSSVAGEEVFAMYDELGFLAMFPRPDRAGPHQHDGGEDEEPAYGYLIYAHQPVVAFDARSGELLNEYCVLFPDRDSEHGPRLPDADDVLAKWMALQGDERRLIGEANMDPPGRQMDPDQLRRDLRTLELWQARRGGDGMSPAS